MLRIPGRAIPSVGSRLGCLLVLLAWTGFASAAAYAPSITCTRDANHDGDVEGWDLFRLAAASGAPGGSGTADLAAFAARFGRGDRPPGTPLPANIRLRGLRWNEAHNREVAEDGSYRAPNWYDRTGSGWFDLLQTTTSFRLGYDQGTPPAGFTDQIRIHGSHIRSATEGTLYATVTEARTFIDFTGLSPGRHYYVRVFRYDARNILIDSSESESCFTLQEQWLAGEKEYSSDFSSDDAFHDAWYRGQFSPYTPPYLTPYVSNGSLVIEDQSPYSRVAGAEAWHSKRNWKLVPPYRLSFQWRAWKGSNGLWPEIACSFYNGEQFYSGIYFTNYIPGQNALLQARVWGNQHSVQSGSLTPDLQMPEYLQEGVWHTAVYDVAVDGGLTCTVDGVRLHPTATLKARDWIAPASVWFMASSNGKVEYRDIKVTVAGAYTPCAGFFDWQNLHLVDALQAGAGFERYFTYTEGDGRAVGALTARSNPACYRAFGTGFGEIEWSELRGKVLRNEAGYPLLYRTGTFGGVLPKVVSPDGFTALQLWGRQKAGSLKVYVRNAETGELVPDSELPGNSSGFAPAGCDPHDRVYRPMTVDLTGVRARALRLHVAGFYNGESLSSGSDVLNYYPSALHGAAFEFAGAPSNASP